ncbi:hypothetical protein M011DRAFT_442532 [Sporormia fimetaria CBS 119925]|uniref:Uncharacterized protein n=1 Tax=Sporormia fimetaria CBS 119925 TaxID=1340428 RepID=A0A6A6VF22_9PLEO|nr:hypothetical protein M011DRAFT_442532 [Sporormia fimetaria CBS 119925]
MRNLLSSLVLLTVSTIAAAAPGPDLVADFIPPLLEDVAQNNETLLEDSLELLKRQNGNCASGYSPCINLNAPGLCCRSTEVCSRDAAQNIACCPRNAACTGSISISAILPSLTSLEPSTIVVPPTLSSTPTVVIITTEPTSFAQPTTGNPSRSMVPNSFYPFPAIPTTYTDAAACSQAYTSCQLDAASCTSALANGVPGVTVSGPNGGATITPIASLGQQSAAQVCASLSSRACSGLVVEACARFGGTGAARTRCPGEVMYGVGAGIAVGIAGQLLQ